MPLGKMRHRINIQTIAEQRIIWGGMLHHILQLLQYGVW